MSFILCLFNLVTCLMGVYQSRRAGRLGVLFWIAIIFFTAYPMVIDSAFVVSGKQVVILDFYADSAAGVKPYVDELILSRAAIFGILFNLCYIVTEFLFLRGRHYRRPLKQPSFWECSKVNLILTVAGYLGLFYMVFIEFGGIHEALSRSVANYGYSGNVLRTKFRYLNSLSMVFIYQSAFGVYYGLRVRRFRYVLVSIIPNLVMAIVTSQRPWLVAISGPIVLYWLQFRIYTKRHLKFDIVTRSLLQSKNIILGLIVIITVLFIMHFVRALRVDSENPYAEALYRTVKVRDVSIFVMYWTFENMPELLPGTAGRSSRDIIYTIMHLPRVGCDELVGAYLAWYRNRWTNTTLHPTIYGWAYCDLLWGGVIWGAIMATIIALIERFVRNSELWLYALSPAVFVMILVCVRGSIHYGIMRAWYAVILTGLMLVVLHRFQPVPGRRRVMATITHRKGIDAS